MSIINFGGFCLDIAFACWIGVVFSFCAFTCKISWIAR